MIADDTVTCSDSRELVKENLKRWRYVLDRKEMKVSTTERMCVNERAPSGTVRLQEVETKNLVDSKYLTSTVQGSRV